jgi:rhodanese-related sulfurtransferase
VNGMTITPEQAARFFAERLELQTDVADVHAARPYDLTLIDARSRAAWDTGHIPGAIHLPHAEITPATTAGFDRNRPVVAYCWGPGCNGATRAALALSRLGLHAREMLGGIEYWIREGFPVATATGETIHDPDPLTTVCGC